MKCVLCNNEAEYTTNWDGPTPLCKDCAKKEAKKLWNIYSHDSFDFEEFYDRIIDESKLNNILATSLNTKTREYE